MDQFDTQLCKPHTSQMIMLAIGTELKKLGDYYEAETGDVCDNNVYNVQMGISRLKSSARQFQQVNAVKPKRWENVAKLLERAEYKSTKRVRRSENGGLKWPEGCQANAALITCSLMKFDEIDQAGDFYNGISKLIHVMGQVCSMTWNRKMAFLLQRLQVAMFC
jgi:hypothetical protein